MIPALLAVPAVEGVIGGVLNCFSSPSAATAAAGPVPSFTPYLNNATTASPLSAVPTASIGTLRSAQWSQMGPADLQTWTKGLAGRHVDATDNSGRTISGVVGGVQQVGGEFALNIGGHLVSLSQLKQITWSPSIA